MEPFSAAIDAIEAARRAELIAADTGTDPALRCDRAEISPGCLIKNGDDVEIGSFVTVRVVCPAEAIGWFNTLVVEGSAIVPGQHEVSQVTDRIPADPNETPMPIFASP